MHSSIKHINNAAYYDAGIAFADSRINTNSESYKSAGEEAVLNLFSSSSSIQKNLNGKSIGSSVITSTHGNWAKFSDSYSYDSNLIPMIITIDGKKCVLLSIVFSVSNSNSKSNYGGEQSSSASSYRLEWEDGTEIVSGTKCSNLYINLLNYDLGTNTAIRLKSSGSGSITVGTNDSCSASYSASISNIVLTYKCFEN